jgi:hypothetical protein
LFLLHSHLYLILLSVPYLHQEVDPTYLPQCGLTHPHLLCLLHRFLQLLLKTLVNLEPRIPACLLYSPLLEPLYRLVESLLM